MVEIQNLTKYYGSKAALKGISFTIKENEVLGFLGPNGAGKSTTLNIMAGVIPSTGGTGKIQGYDIAQQPVKAKKCIGFLPEIPPVYPDMKVREYLHFAAGLKGIPAAKRKGEVERVMERLKITDVQKRLIRNLSKGYKQRVGFAMADGRTRPHTADGGPQSDPGPAPESCHHPEFTHSGRDQCRL